MFFFKKKSPEEKQAAHIAKMRRTESERGFGGGAMVPYQEIEVGDVSIVRMDPENKRIAITCSNRKAYIPYSALRDFTMSSECEIVRGESPITLQEMNDLLADRAGLFVGELYEDAAYHARWFARIVFEDEFGLEKHLMFLAYSMRGPYMATSKLYGGLLFEENFRDILDRQRLGLELNSDGQLVRCVEAYEPQPLASAPEKDEEEEF